MLNGDVESIWFGPNDYMCTTDCFICLLLDGFDSVLILTHLLNQTKSTGAAIGK